MTGATEFIGDGPDAQCTAAGEPVPLFVCGMARSGTTVFVRLLDGHPALAVMPTETQVYSALTRPVVRRPLFLVHRFAPASIVAWLGRQPMASLVFQGRRSLWRRLLVWSREYRDRTDNHEFAREAMAGVRGPAQYWSAFVKLYCLLTDTTLAGKRFWVEKTPLSERFVPATDAWCRHRCRYLHVLRDPRDVSASSLIRAAELGPDWPRERALVHLCHVWSSSVGWYRRNRSRYADRYHALRYEDVVANPQQTMTDVCRVLDIDMHPSLLTPTALGATVRANSSYADTAAAETIVNTQRQRYREVLSAAEVELIEVLTGAQMLACGYTPVSGSTAGRFTSARLPTTVRRHVRSALKARLTCAVQRSYAGERLPMLTRD
jgi:hypothetical protein